MKGKLSWICAAVMLAVGCGESGTRVPAEPTASTVSQESAALSSAAEASKACLAKRNEMFQNVSRMLERHAKGCAVDTDCAVVETRLSCQEGCTAAISKTAKGNFERELVAYDAQVCAGLPKTCTAFGSCMRIESARCEQGQCMPVFAGMAQP